MVAGAATDELVCAVVRSAKPDQPSFDHRVEIAGARVREANFLLDGLVGIDLHGKTVGVIGTGRTGAVVARVMRGRLPCTGS
jgi:phosphoglycerate dehydrogenase-like enzyme